MPDARVNVLLGDDRLPADVLGLLSRIEIRESDDEPTVCALRLALRQRGTGTFRPIDDEVFVPLALLQVDVAAPGGRPQRLFRGYVTHVRPHFEPSLPDCYVEVVAMDASVLMDAGERVAEYPDATDADAAAEVFARYDLVTDIDDTPARHVTSRRLLLQRTTDWRFVRQLARRNGYDCYLEFDAQQDTVVAHFHPRRLQEQPQPDLAILHDQANLRWVDVQAVHLGPTAHVGAAIDPVSKTRVRSDGARRDAILGPVAAADASADGLAAAGADITTGLLVLPFGLSEAIEAQGTAATDRDGWAYEARGEVDSAAYRGLLRARRTVLLKGIGTTHSGTWYVRAVRTVLDQGALSQTFVAQRNAHGLAGTEDFGASAEEIPAQ